MADDPDRRDDDQEQDAKDEKSAVKEHSPLPSLPRGLRVNAIAEPLLQRLQLFFDSALRLEPGEFVGDCFLATEIEHLDLALHLVERALDLFETGKGVGNALVIE